MADFYFFTEPDKLEVQTEEQAFGPVTPVQVGSYVTGKNRFKITSLHNSTDPSVKAFAICSGTIQVQETNQVGIVNTILKPNHSPEKLKRLTSCWSVFSLQSES